MSNSEPDSEYATRPQADADGHISESDDSDRSTAELSGVTAYMLLRSSKPVSFVHTIHGI